MVTIGGNNGCIPPTLEGWVYIIHIHGPLDEPLYTWAQYTPTVPTGRNNSACKIDYNISCNLTGLTFSYFFHKKH